MPSRILYKYMPRQFALSYESEGGFRIGTLYDYRKNEHVKGIADDQEGKKSIVHDLDYVIFDAQGVSSGSQIDVDALRFFNINDVDGLRNFAFSGCRFSTSVNSEDFYIYCFSDACSKEAMAQFEGADVCFEVINLARLLSALDSVLSRFADVEFKGIFKVHYQDRIEKWNGRDWGRHPSVIKEKKFSKQSEWRAIWRNKGADVICPVVEVNERIPSFVRRVDL